MRFRVLACCRVGKRGAFAKTLMTCGRPPAKNSARRFSRPPSRPYGCADFSSKGMSRRGSKEAAFFGLGLRGSLESSLRLPKLAQRAEDTKWNPTLSDLTY